MAEGSGRNTPCGACRSNRPEGGTGQNGPARQICGASKPRFNPAADRSTARTSRLGGLRLAKVGRAGALLDLPSENLANDGQGEKMRHDERQAAILVKLAKLVTAKVAELFLVDHLEAAINERLLSAFRLDRDFALHEQV